MLVGAGSGSKSGGSGLDIANLLKPPLARGELQCIGATTLEEHRKHIERDAALERRFQPVLVAEPTQAETLAILHGLQVGLDTVSDRLFEAMKAETFYLQGLQVPSCSLGVLAANMARD